MPRASARRAPGARPPSAGDLERLLEAEQRLEAVVHQARDEAAALVRAARERVAEQERETEEAGAAALSDLEHRIGQETERAVAEIRARGAREAARFGQVSAERVAALADHLVARLLEEES